MGDVVPYEPPERPLKMAARQQAPNRKPAFWSSHVHGIPQNYATGGLPPETPPRRSGEQLSRPVSANAMALAKRDQRLQVKEEAAIQARMAVIQAQMAARKRAENTA